ncbi:putative P-loop containing nucleoside triphosphate hydrolase [Lupinus albus]|uniref:Putative P-loop containing nucleoside triphosphate hydrolase n=1 Tax=Lupinus albus TaxID=3870 RepID=A0A6A4MXU0_LUPAL|nr:putative P-loop containing nucleoside triphosphate hydrolase [Lupinus albus]
MGSRGRPLFDLNEPPADDNDESDGVVCFQPQKTLPSTNPHGSDLFAASSAAQGIVNNNAFQHASSVSGFQPFVRPKSAYVTEADAELKRTGDQDSKACSLSNRDEDVKATESGIFILENAQSTEREEGEWSDEEASANVNGSSNLKQQSQPAEEKSISGTVDECVAVSSYSKSSNIKVSDSINEEKSSRVSIGLESNSSSSEQKSNSIPNSESNIKSDASIDAQEEPNLVPKQKEVKGIEASHAQRCANNPGKRKLDQRKEEMLGKKRNRQTVFLKLEDVKQAGPIKTSTPRRQTFASPVVSRTVKDVRTVPAQVERVGIVKEQKQVDSSFSEGGTNAEPHESKSDSNGDSSVPPGRSRRLNSETESPTEINLPPIPRLGSWKQPTDSRQQKNAVVSNRKSGLSGQSSNDVKLGNKKLPMKKHVSVSNQSQDTSVERLIREVTSEKFWHNPEETELQCVPGRFESVEEYVRVFEPLLFEECRAQLYSTWEESTETVSRDTHIMVRVKANESRERGWYDVKVIPVHDFKWSFKEGDVAVLSSPRPGSARFKQNSASLAQEDGESEITGRVVGTVRRNISIDTRDPPGAILHYFVGDSYDPSRGDDDHIIRKLKTGSIWYLTVLGSLATTQREYVALHAFRRLNLQMQTAILQPSPEHFPKYEQHTPAMPECFTPNFVEYLRRTFNEPQLAAIQWAAMHTAAGTSSGTTRRQDPWPFTLVQGPPGTGKTHTVWGMLNVIHLVQYQHYYTSLLKHVAPESYKHANDISSDSVSMGSIDEVLQNMDQNLLHSLPKLVPKPRMLVCAPSNAATDELLSRVLDRGFIDGEMKVYRPDVARVGVDSQTRAAQAVSVERRTEQLLVKSREEVLGWMHQLKTREAQLTQQLHGLHRELNATAAGRSQGSVGVDPDLLVAQDQNRDALLQNLAAVVEGRDKVLVEMSRLALLESRFRPGSGFNLEEVRASLEASFANEAEVVFTTVSSSGRKLFSRLSHGFDMVVIDEAAQASEMAVLPPLALGAARCVLVGDPQQLPATVISKAAGTLMYSRSLFERFQQAGCPTMLLSVQYRMHPQIRDFPSRYFYQGRLTDSESVVKLHDEVYYKDPLLKPYIFYDIRHGRESHRGGSVSYQNVHEAQFCLRLYEHLQKTLKSLGLGKITVGIITPYKLQLKCLQREFEEVLNSEEGKDLYINTVDAFQGQERDVIIMSCVRASSHGVGFVADIRRMNVALTRARRALWVMGNANALVQSDDWAALITDAKSRNCYMEMDSLPKDFLVSKGPTYTPLPGKSSTNMRGSRSAAPRYRPMDMHIESRSGAPSEDDDKMNAPVSSRNGNHRPSRYSMENSVDNSDHMGDKSRDAWQHGIQKKPNSAGTMGKRDV